MALGDPSEWETYAIAIGRVKEASARLLALTDRQPQAERFKAERELKDALAAYEIARAELTRADQRG